MRPAERFRRSLALAFLALFCLIAQAQDTGQICLLAFVDQDEDGQRVGTEAPIARGIAASLLDERGVTIRSQLLEDSPYASDGLLCFEGLLAGEYGIIISSSEYNATTATVAAASVQPGAAPARIDFGAKPLALAAAPNALASLSALDADAVQTLLVAGGASAVLIIVISLLGSLMVALLLRRRRRSKAPALPSIEMSGTSPAARAQDEPLPPRLTEEPGQGSPPVFTDHDEQW